VKITSRQLRKALTYLCGRFMRQGYRRFVLISAHGGVPFAGALDAVCERLNRRGAKAAAPTAAIAVKCYQGDYIEPLRASGVTIPKELEGLFLQDLHGGFLETSMMLAIRPDLVGDYRTQPPILVKKRWWIALVEKAVVALARRLPISENLKEEISLGAKIGAIDLSWILRGRLEGYHGAPAFADAALGDALLDLVAADVTTAMEHVFDGKREPEAFRSSARLFSWAKGFGAGIFVLAFAMIFLALR